MTARRRPRVSERKPLMNSFNPIKNSRGRTLPTPLKEVKTLKHSYSDQRLDTANSCDGIAAELPII